MPPYKKIKLSLLSLSVCAAIALAPLTAKAETYKLDPTHTAVTWKLSHFGFSNPSGKFMNVDGSVEFDEKNPTASKVNVTIPIALGLSGVPKLDEHMQGTDFFDVKKYPTATFKSTKVEVTGDKTANVTGDLTIRGITKPVVLAVRFNKAGENMMKLKTIGFTAAAQIKRSDFGMKAYVPDLGDDVRIDIEAEANVIPPLGTTPMAPASNNSK